MHKASDLGGNIYKSRSGSKFLKFRARLLRSSFLPSRRKNSVFTSGGESSRFRRTIIQRAAFTSHVTTSLKRLFPSRISNHYSNSWSQHCNGAILHYLRLQLISRGPDYHSIPSNFATITTRSKEPSPAPTKLSVKRGSNSCYRKRETFPVESHSETIIPVGVPV